MYQPVYLVFTTLYYFCLFAAQIRSGEALLCYSCVSTEPGCTLTSVDWLIHSAVRCPQSEDKCVKIIEQRGAELTVTRDCLSTLIPYRTDIPADHFEGCRPAAAEPNRAVFVGNQIGELEIHRSHYTNTTYCFCEFDEWCNAAHTATRPSFLGLLGLLTLTFVLLTSLFTSMSIII